MIKRAFAIISCLGMGAAVIAAPAVVTDVNSGSLEQRLATLERMVTTRTDAQHRIQQQLDTMQDEVNELRGNVELHNHKLEQILERQRELYLEIDKRIDAVLKKPASAASTLPAANTVAENTVASMGESDAYDKAVDLILKEKQYDQAIPQLQAFLQSFPQSSYVPNVHYWLGQLFFIKQSWADAATHFEQVVTQYTDSSKRADSMLKLGIVVQKQGNGARAEQLFEQVIAEYPDSSSRKLADTRLRELKLSN